MRYIFSTLVIALANIQFANAQLGSPIKAPRNVGGSGATLLSIACLGLRWLFTAAIIFSIVLVVLAAFEYMRSAGDPAKVKSATNRIVYAAIGVAVAILARTVPILVGSVLNVSGGTDVGAICR
jgi:hypothetical protein